MSGDPLRLADYLGHILEAIDRIERYTSSLDAAAFLLSEMAQDAVIRNFEVIGEACRNIVGPDALCAAPRATSRRSSIRDPTMTL